MLVLVVVVVPKVVYTKDALLVVESKQVSALLVEVLVLLISGAVVHSVHLVTSVPRVFVRVVAFPAKNASIFFSDQAIAIL